jgi:hypothetical protein
VLVLLLGLVLAVVLEVGCTRCPAWLAWFGLGCVPKMGAKAAGAGNPDQAKPLPRIGVSPE